MNKFDFGATLARHLIQTAHRAQAAGNRAEISACMLNGIRKHTRAIRVGKYSSSVFFFFFFFNNNLRNFEDFPYSVFVILHREQRQEI